MISKDNLHRILQCFSFKNLTGPVCISAYWPRWSRNISVPSFTRFYAVCFWRAKSPKFVCTNLATLSARTLPVQTAFLQPVPGGTEFLLSLFSQRFSAVCSGELNLQNCLHKICNIVCKNLTGPDCISAPCPRWYRISSVPVFTRN